MNPVVYKQGDSHLYLPIGDKGMAFVDYRDVAALLVGIGLDSDRVAKHAGKKWVVASFLFFFFLPQCSRKNMVMRYSSTLAFDFLFLSIVICFSLGSC